MKHDDHDHELPRWMRLAATLRAEPRPDTLARVRRRLVAGAAEPSWFRWLARPVAVATSAALLVLSAVAGNALLTGAAADTTDESTFTAALLGDDGSFGLGVERTSTSGTASSDSEEVVR